MSGREKIVICNDLAELRRMSQWLSLSAARAAIPERLVPVLELCANEAVANIINYAFADRGPHEIIVELARTERGGILVIRDDGRPFDPLALPEFQPPATLEEARIGGLGVHLIRRMASRCEYRREGGMNVLCLEAESVPEDA